MASAMALGHDSLRLRSRRIRSKRSHRLPLGFVVVVVVVASAVGFVGGRISLSEKEATPVADAATLEQQRFATDLRPIHAEIEQSVMTVGLVVASYEAGEIDAKELQRRLSGVLVAYADATAVLGSLTPPVGSESTVTAYMSTVSSLARSGQELSKALDDGDQARIAAALGQTLQIVARLNDLSVTPG